MQKIQISDSEEVSALVDESASAKRNILLAHGAGAGMEHLFMSDLAKALTEQGFRVIRFNFPYKERGKKMPGSPKEAVACWEALVEYVHQKHPEEPLFIAGKSYGGRMASHLIAQNGRSNVAGIIYYGFPLHAPGKPSTKRAVHLPLVKLPQLFLQGTNDKLADINLLKEVVEPLDQASLVPFDHADHSFKAPKSQGISPKEMITQLAKETAAWADRL